jgi:hypothetical protein
MITARQAMLLFRLMAVLARYLFGLSQTLLKQVQGCLNLVHQARLGDPLAFLLRLLEM